MQRSGFFNALAVNGVYDRKYNADDYCDNLAFIISNGVLRSDDDDLKVTTSGMIATVGVGRGWINGHWYVNDTPHSFASVSAPTGGSRYDRIFLRLDKSLAERKISLVYVQGTASNSPTLPAPTREGDIYDLVLADILVGANATSLTVTDKRSDPAVCGWVYSTSGDNSFFEALDNQFAVWFEEKKDTVASTTVEVEYRQLTTLTAQASAVSITIPQYDSTINQKLEVYVNGIRQYTPSDYSVDGAVIRFTSNLIAGTEVTIYITVSKDGTGIPSVVDDVTELQTKVAALENGVNDSTYNYICNGINDNVVLSNLVQTWLNGGTDYASRKFSVHGTFGISAAYGGSGTSASPYRWFSLGGGNSTSRRAIVDFSSCTQITISCPDDSYNVIFYGLQVFVIGANVVATGGTQVTMFSTVGLTQSHAERCRFWITSQNGYMTRGGVFKDCRCSLTTTAGDAFCFNVLKGGLLRLFGGEYYAYAPSSQQSAIVYVNSAQAGAVVNTYSISCPQVARNSYVQTYAINVLSNDACCSFTDTITTLTMQAAGQNIRGTIATDIVAM